MKDNLGWPEGQLKACGFVRLGSYLIPGAEGKLPGKGVHQFHIFVLLPLTQQPWKATYAWVKRTTQGPFTENAWLSGGGPVIGILNHDAIQDFSESDTDTTILVVTPETFEVTTGPNDLC